MSQGNGSPHFVPPGSLADPQESHGERLARLETRTDVTESQIGELTRDVKQVLLKLERLPTVDDNRRFLAIVGTIAFAVIAVFVGVLTYLQEF